MSFIIIILAVVLISIVLLWVVESRVFLLLFQKLFYKTYKEAVFPNDLSKYFPEYQVLEKNIDVIRKELTFLLQEHQRIPKLHELDVQNKRVSFDKGPGWRTYYMKAYNGWFKENCSRCPNTTALLNNMDSVLTAMFSIMEPGNEIPPHTGKFFGFLRYQLPLLTPKKGHCAITVDNAVYHYKEGDSIIFDDTVEHSVVNYSEEIRVVLFLDIDKAANPFVGMLNRFFMRLIVVSPVFKKGALKAYKS